MQHNYKDKRKNRKKGFTLAEALIVIGIIAVLAALIVIAVFAYLRSLTKLEYDGYAKELFIAAQNHLSMAESEGYLGRTDFGSAEDKQVNNKDGVYYFVKDSTHANVDDGNSVLNLMLPFASIEETVRENGCYIVRYHKDSATVLDVFYWEESGRYAHTFTDADYANFIAKKNEEDKSELRTYEDDNSVIGWYGGADAQNLTHGSAISSPLLSVTNADRLIVTIKDNVPLETKYENVKLKLIITGLTSKNMQEFEITRDNSSGDYSMVLDDITNGQHFYQLFCGPEQAKPLIPGEDITLLLVEYNNSELTNIAYSPIITTNSLFAYNDSGDNSAHISYIRHLENLDPAVSNVNTTDTNLKHVSDSEVSAKQTTDFTWDSSTYEQITKYNGDQLTDHLFKPIDTDSYYNSRKLTYDGKNHSISSVVVSVTETDEDAGLFTHLKTGDAVQNLKLVDFNVYGKANVGALAGSASSATVTNVVVCNNGSDSATDATIKGTNDAGTNNVGGLIGSATNCTISRSAAAVIVESSGNAGGLIGSAAGGSVSASYSGGHTSNGSYKEVTYTDANDGNKQKIKYNVTGGASAGGLIGQAANTTVSTSYSTCSAKGTTAGGLLGSSEGSSFTYCYSTGLVEGTDAGAFIGVLDSGSLANCYYYDIINEKFKTGTDGKSGFEYMAPIGKKTNIDDGSIGISAIDQTAATYEAFVGDNDGLDYQWQPAVAYDQILNIYYQGKYNLKTVEQLEKLTDPPVATVTTDDFVLDHYGDWPAPEIWTFNEQLTS